MGHVELRPASLARPWMAGHLSRRHRPRTRAIQYSREVEMKFHASPRTSDVNLGAGAYWIARFRGQRR